MSTAEIKPATPVPFMSLERHHQPLAGELRSAIDGVLDDGGFVLGPEVTRFEEEFAAYCGVEHCIGAGSGTAALTLALMAAGVGPGDEVIVPAHTFIASALAVVHAGAKPVFCDVEAGTGLIDVNSAAAAIGPATAAIVAVHLYGQVCDMDALDSLAARHGLLVVEDAAQAHGARWREARAGSLGTVAAFSFYPSKNLGALGDGGAICTDDEEIAARARRLGNLGQARKGVHLEAGMNERLDGIQAAVLRVKLGRLDGWNAERRILAATYRRALEDVCDLLAEDPRGECVYHLFPVRIDNRDAVREVLAERGIGSGVHYWPALHRQPPFTELLARRDFSLINAARWSEQELSLPLFPELSESEVLNVAESLHYAIEVTK
ncbi:MAG TPA: DegT/DnrJ/EryC1/StrS family aminotransferase [Solirubrobacterales bacterium]|nr:DegT/DnrJ/EryC1/StrS family aminotransferase [Solirubrobacterales bacterium]